MLSLIYFLQVPILLDFVGFCWVLLDFVGFCWVLVGFVGFCWVLLGFVGFSWVLLGFVGHALISPRFPSLAISLSPSLESTHLDA